MINLKFGKVKCETGRLTEFTVYGKFRLHNRPIWLFLGWFYVIVWIK